MKCFIFISSDRIMAHPTQALESFMGLTAPQMILIVIVSFPRMTVH
jgi:hypothetical protein